MKKEVTDKYEYLTENIYSDSEGSRFDYIKESYDSIAAIINNYDLIIFS